MPRNQTQGTTLRNRNRVTNKTRLKVVRGNIDADPLILDEEEERARVIATSGVDADDANEHHLQVAINAAAQRHSAFAQDLKAQDGTSQREKKEPYIPTPDAAGIVKNYERHYPTDRWSTPQTYLRFADTLEDTVQYGLSNGFSYYMDERDKEWLEKNNQAANGESTSAQAIVSGGLTARASRSSKLKGKDPDICIAVHMKEDEFELIMGLFEKETDERYPFLHVDPAQIPPYSEYEPLFNHLLPVAYFSSFAVPHFASDPSRNTALAAAIYPHWRERRKERNGRRIVAQLNADESNENDPYVCFRRRDSKPIRKTRTGQNAITERMIRLKAELGQAYSLALTVLQREQSKRLQLQSSCSIWKTRATVLDLKRKLGSNLSKEDEELLVDKERPTKKPRTAENMKWPVSQKAAAKDAVTLPVEPRPSPKERYQRIHSDIVDDVMKHRDKCSSWEDVADLPYQLSALQASGRSFTQFTGSPVIPGRLTSLRLRYGRGGRLILDRHFCSNRGRIRLGLINHEDNQESRRRKEEQWRFDADNLALDQDETDRFILDDFHERYNGFSSTLLTEEDRLALSTDTHSFHPMLTNDVVKSQRTIQQRKYFSDSNNSTSIQPSPPPTMVPSSTTSSSLGNEASRIPTKGTSGNSGLATSTTAPPVRALLSHQNASPSHPTPSSNADLLSPNGEQFPCNSLQAQAHTMHIPSIEHNTLFHAPSIARHKLQSSHPFLPSQQSNLQLLGGGPQIQGNTSPHINGDMTGQRPKTNLNGIQKVQGQTHHAAGLVPAPTSSTSFYPLNNITFNGQSNAENINLAMGSHLNLKLPTNRRVILPSDTPSSTVLPTGGPGNLDPRSPMICAGSLAGNRLSSPFRGTPSPCNGTFVNGSNSSHTSPSPRPHSLANPGQRVSVSPAAQGPAYHHP